MIELIFLTVTAGILLYSFKDIGNIEVSKNAGELRDLASKMYNNLTGKKFVLSAGELNYKAYVGFSKLIEEHLKKDDTNFTIYCGPKISISDEYNNLIDMNGKILDDISEEKIQEIHPIISLMYKYPDKLILKLKDERIDEHFFYSEDDKMAWKEKKHEPFEESISYFKNNANKATFNNLKKLENKIESKDLTKDNIKEIGIFFTKEMFEKEVA